MLERVAIIILNERFQIEMILLPSFSCPNFDFIYAGPTYMFSSGSIQWLMVSDIDMVKDVIMHTSLNLGKPTYLSKDMGPLLGKGIITSSGPIWSHQKKIIAPELYLDKVKVSVFYPTPPLKRNGMLHWPQRRNKWGVNITLDP